MQDRQRSQRRLCPHRVSSNSNLVGSCRGHRCECVGDTSASVAKFDRRPHANPSSVGTADRLPTDIPTDGFVGKCAKREKNCCKYTLPLSHTPSVGVSAGAWGCARQWPVRVLHVSRARDRRHFPTPILYGKFPRRGNNHPCGKPSRPRTRSFPPRAALLPRAMISAPASTRPWRSPHTPPP